MNIVHPFDAILRRLDPDTHRVTVDELVLLGRGELAISLLLAGSIITIIDLTVHADAGSFSFSSPQPIPIAFMGRGINVDGTFEPFAFSAEPCKCGDIAHESSLWNPLSLGLAWHPELPPNLGAIGQAYWVNLKRNRSKYCSWGMAVLDEQL